jgi:hypothetical protein
MITQLNANLQPTGNTTTNAADSFSAKRLPIQLDMGSFERVLKEEIVIAEEGSMNSSNVSDAGDSDDLKKDAKINSDIDTILSQLMETRLSNNGTFLTVRVLYVVPAKTSRRRGKIHGCAYVLLTVPPQLLVETHNQLTEKSKSLACHGDSKVEDINPGNLSAQEKPTQFRPTAAERTRYVSWAKLQLLLATEAWAEMSQNDTKSSSPRWDGACQVSASISGKIWRNDKASRDRREGTVEQSSDYKQYFILENKSSEERQNRPKPTPGGGYLGISSTGGNASDAGDVDQKVAAVVLHLRSKHEEEAKRNKTKSNGKKAVHVSSKEGGNKGRKTSTTVGIPSKVGNSTNKGRSSNAGSNTGVLRGKGRGKTPSTSKSTSISKMEGGSISSPRVLSKPAPNGTS